VPANLRAFDWSASPLGPKEAWPPALATTYDIMMASDFGMCAMWGPERTLLYNEAYIPFLGARHPGALGQSIDSVWQDVWADIAPLVDAVLVGKTQKFEDMRLLMTRNGFEEETYWTFSYSPLRDGERICGFLNVAMETTKLILAQQRAEQFAERVQLALAAGAIIGTWVWELPCDQFAVDEAFASNFGLDPALGHKGLSLEQVIATVHPEDRDGLLSAIDLAIARGGLFAHQYRVRRADGHYYWIEANGRVEMSAQGKATRFPGVLIDIEGRRAVEAERDQAIARLRALNTTLEQKVAAQSLARGRNWQLSPDLLGVLDTKGRFDTSNPAWQAVLGWSEDKISSCTFFDLVHPDDVLRTREAWDRTFGQGQLSLRLENRLQHREGGWRWLSWVAVADEDRVYCSARDITLEKERQTALIERTAERDRLWENTNDLMGTGDFNGRLRSINGAWERLLGRGLSDILQRPVMELVERADIVATREVLSRLSKGEEVSGFVNRLLAHDGSTRTIMWTAKPDTLSRTFFMVGRDMTALHSAEESLRQAQKMEAVGQLTGGIAHDFNNLLSGIMGSLELMAVRIKEGKTQNIEKYRAAAHTAAERAALLTHRLLAFSRRQALAPKPIDLNDVVAGLIDMIERTVGPSITVETTVESAIWLVLVDVSQLENALLNLAINARDAMPNGGFITIETRNDAISGERARALDLPEGKYVCLSLMDTGSGMSDSVIAKAFDPFFTTKPIGQGTGLGLSMIYGFAKQSGGQVKISSVVGRGSQVCIYFPRHRAELFPESSFDGALYLPPQSEPEPVAPVPSGKTILVVDDEITVRELIAESLSDSGYVVIQAGDGNAGLKILESDVHIDLLVSDVGLPGGMNGRQMADFARIARPDLKVLFITGYAETALFSKTQIDSGMSLLTKPFNIQTLQDKISEMV